MNLGVIIDGTSPFIAEVLEDWRQAFHTECFEFTPLKLPFLGARVNEKRYRFSLQSFLRRNDVVFFEWAGKQLAYASRLKTNTPLVARLHSWELFGFANQIRWDAVSRVVLVSEAMRRKFVGRFPEQSAKTEVVYPGKSLSRFRARPNQFSGRIGMICDLNPVKRVYDMILTLYSLTKKGYDLTLHLAGGPTNDPESQRYQVSIERAVDHLNLRGRVVFHGWITDPALFLQGIDIFVSNSYWEGMQNALVEAMATGCYCLSHFWEGVEEVLPDRYIYVTSGDLEEKITAYCECSQDRKWAHQGELRTIVSDKFNMSAMLARMRGIVMQAGGAANLSAMSASPSSSTPGSPLQRESQSTVTVGDQDSGG
ncbi:MAG: glycosyltransferase family 4 protein [Bryobacteraceae bacterium]